MSPVTHFLTGWILANSTALSRRDRALVTWSVVVPDIDGLGIVAEVATHLTLYCGSPATITRCTILLLRSSLRCWPLHSLSRSGRPRHCVFWGLICFCWRICWARGGPMAIIGRFLIWRRFHLRAI